MLMLTTAAQSDAGTATETACVRTHVPVRTPFSHCAPAREFRVSTGCAWMREPVRRTRRRCECDCEDTNHSCNNTKTECRHAARARARMLCDVMSSGVECSVHMQTCVCWCTGGSRHWARNVRWQLHPFTISALGFTAWKYYVVTIKCGPNMRMLLRTVVS